MRKTGRQSTKKTSLAARRQQALELRKQGYSFAAIGRKLDIDQATAYRDVSHVLKELHETAVEDAKEVRRIELQRLDDMLLALKPKADKGDVAAVDRVLRIQERRAKYLGLDAAKQVEASVVAPEVYLPKGRQNFDPSKLRPEDDD